MRWLFFIGVLMFSVVAQAQNEKRTISGVVTSFDEGSPIENAGVWVKDGKNNSGTQADGVYYIIVSSADSVLVFAAEGFQQEEIRLSVRNEYNVKLHKKNSAQPSGVTVPVSIDKIALSHTMLSSFLPFPIIVPFDSTLSDK